MTKLSREFLDALKAKRDLNRDAYRAYQRSWRNKHLSEERLRDRTRGGGGQPRGPYLSDWLGRAKKRAKLIGVPFDLDYAYIEPLIPTHCPILGIKLCRDPKTGYENYPSIDRLIPELGYVRGNVWVISFRANTLKSNATLDEMRLVLAAVEKIEEFKIRLRF